MDVLGCGVHDCVRSILIRNEDANRQNTIIIMHSHKPNQKAKDKMQMVQHKKAATTQQSIYSFSLLHIPASFDTNPLGTS